MQVFEGRKLLSVNFQLFEKILISATDSYFSYNYHRRSTHNLWLLLVLGLIKNTGGSMELVYIMDLFH